MISVCQLERGSRFKILAGHATAVTVASPAEWRSLYHDTPACRGEVLRGSEMSCARRYNPDRKWNIEIIAEVLAFFAQQPDVQIPLPLSYYCSTEFIPRLSR